MTKPAVILDSSQAVVSQMAAQIYAAYITHGDVKDEEKAKWMERSIREALRIAKTVDASLKTAEQSDSNADVPDATSRTPAPKPPAPEPPESGAAASARNAMPDLELDRAVGEALSGEQGSTYKVKD